MLKNNFIVPIVDTDSITICKVDGGIFSQEELDNLTDDLNNQFDDLIRWELEFSIPMVICIRAKNYVLFDGKKAKIKGSALKATTKSPAMKEMIGRIIQSFLDGKTNQQDIYLEYIKEAARVTDINRWAVRKTISETTLSSERTNESKIRDAIEGTEIVEGDRCYMFTAPDNTLRLVDKFDGNYHVDNLLKNVYNTIQTFDNVLDCEMFLNYSLKRNKKLLEELLNGRN